MKNILSALFLFLVLLPGKSFAGIYFDNLNINDDNTIVYTVTKDIPGTKKYSALHSVKINGMNKIENPDILTCFPEKIKILDEGKKIWITNLYGNSTYDFSEKKLTPVLQLSSLQKNNSIYKSMLSPDGQWQIYLNRSPAGKNELIVYNIREKKYVILDKDAPFNEANILVKWSSDSKNFIYQKNENLYFCNPESMLKGFQIDEKYRKIGKGKINCIQWINNDSFVYIDSDIVYLIDSREFISLGIYSNIFSIGTVIGRLSDSYDQDNSQFSIDSTASKMILVKNNNSIYFYDLQDAKDSNYIKQLNLRTSIHKSEENYNAKIYWKENATPFICVDSISEDAEKVSSIYSFNDEYELTKMMSVKKTSTDFAISKNSKFVSFAIDSVVYIFSTDTWNCIERVSGDKVVSLAWINDYCLCIGGREVVRLYDFNSKKQNILFLSSANVATWDKNNGSIICYNERYKVYFSYDKNLRTWKVLQNAEPQEIKVQNSSYRIYKANLKNQIFDNGIFVRNLTENVKTFPLYKEVLQKNIDQKKISIIFDLTDNAFGVNEIIALCKKYELKVTFFINGEFIRRYPFETKKIANTDSEIGSLFYTNVDLTANEFDITSEYVKKGLARNEDEYFLCTGKELSLIWHAPFYKSNKLIREAGREAGYKYVDYPLEENTFNTKAGKAIENKIIPIFVGLDSKNQSKIFYDKLELLINSLLESNYQIVPLSELQ